MVRRARPILASSVAILAMVAASATLTVGGVRAQPPTAVPTLPMTVSAPLAGTASPLPAVDSARMELATFRAEAHERSLLADPGDAAAAADDSMPFVCQIDMSGAATTDPN